MLQLENMGIRKSGGTLRDLHEIFLKCCPERPWESPHVSAES